ncbi:autotransporter outer membrane beta-barrel domain-containing protein, partial [Desulfovibrio litoralis]
EGIVSGVAFINQGADLAAGQGMGSALSSANAAGAGNLSSFGAMSAGSSRYNTGSHSDVDSFSLMTGLGWNAPIAQNSLLLGAFFEVGFGNYDSHNSFSGRASIDGSGDTEYYGGGILARYSLTEGFLEGLYTEASLRVGHVSTDFSSNDFEAFSGPINVSYDSSSVYYGAHAGLGYIWQLSEKADLDFSTKYFWTHQNGDDVTVAGDPIKFEDADSHRWRNGVRFSYEIDKNATPYVGAAYDYEFDGKANATAYGRSIEAPELKGGTGVGELGIILKPMVNHDFSVDLGLQGYTGMREGVSGSLQMKYEF